MQFRTISLDLLFVATMDVSLPENLDIMQNRILRGMDEKSVRSVNGCRVTDIILAKVMLDSSCPLTVHTPPHRQRLCHNVRGASEGR